MWVGVCGQTAQPSNSETHLPEVSCKLVDKHTDACLPLDSLLHRSRIVSTERGKLSLERVAGRRLFGSLQPPLHDVKTQLHLLHAAVNVRQDNATCFADREQLLREAGQLRLLLHDRLHEKLQKRCLAVVCLHRMKLWGGLVKKM